LRWRSPVPLSVIAKSSRASPALRRAGLAPLLLIFVGDREAQPGKPGVT